MIYVFSLEKLVGVYILGVYGASFSKYSLALYFLRGGAFSQVLGKSAGEEKIGGEFERGKGKKGGEKRPRGRSKGIKM